MIKKQVEDDMETTTTTTTTEAIVPMTTVNLNLPVLYNKRKKTTKRVKPKSRIVSLRSSSNTTHVKRRTFWTFLLETYSRLFTVTEDGKTNIRQQTMAISSLNFFTIGFFLPRSWPSLDPVRTFAYCFGMSQFATIHLHSHAYVLMMPLTMWIAGCYEIRATSYSKWNAVISVLFMMFVSPILASIPHWFIWTGILSIAKRKLSTPRLFYDTPWSVTWTVTITLIGLFYGLKGFQAMLIQNGSMQAMFFTILFAADLFPISHGIDMTKDSYWLEKVRVLSFAITSYLIWMWVNTVLYFVFGLRVYHAIRWNHSQL
jgi:hypothetical protein